MLAGSRERRPDGDCAAALRSYCLIPHRSSQNLHVEVTDYSYRHFLFVDTSHREIFLVLVCVKKKKEKPQSLFLLDGLFLIPVDRQPAAFE